MSSKINQDSKQKSDVAIFHIGHDELIIRQRYEVLSIANDILIGTWFIIGSIFFFYPSLTFTATWLFLIGSIEMMIRPVIRLTRKVHLSRYRPSVNSHDVVDEGYDY
ncbi:YrhK family protein [Halomonas elongata]|uniref:YrhK domain protein n=2 Tax=Halomonas elongata TaxID=2746 RepID=A0A1R4A4B5_HALED|nr:YrhK family protein [Halomonas elongata]MBW5799094.1 YrhK family protein [Halomonas elongata]MDL4862462.1 YrhK family protein [Halomonas elongata]OBX36516.1 hypothetical protein A8U91_00859 [Halomonas elongata]RAW08892.1 hypothetical protein DKQ62_01375 [Halomonas elongata]WBF19651.1 YrhK family protein [Halomonas elongata]